MNGVCLASLATELAARLGANLPVATRVEYLLIGVAGFLMLGAALVSWLGFVKSRRRKRSPHRHHHSSGASSSSSSGSQRESRTARTQGRRRRRGEYPRRPTLAESGGLPPLRPPPSGPQDFLPY